jgi:hypothetical protein
MADYGQDLVDRGTERLKGTWEYAGEEKDLIVEDISYPDFKLVQQYGALSAQLAALEDADPDEVDGEDLEEQVDNLGDFSWEGENEDPDFIPSMISEKLVQPKLNPESDDVPARLVRAIVQGMMETWQESDEVSKAREEMPLEGNG